MPFAAVLLSTLRVNNMNLIGATYIRAVQIIISTSQVGWPDPTEFDFRPRLTSESTAWIAI